MKTISHATGNPAVSGVPGTTAVPLSVVPETAYVQETLARLPLAGVGAAAGCSEVADPPHMFLQGTLLTSTAAAATTKSCHFHHDLVQLIADALLHYDGKRPRPFRARPARRYLGNV